MNLRCFDCGAPATHVCTLLIGAPDVKRLVCDKGVSSFADSDFWAIRLLNRGDYGLPPLRRKAVPV